MSVQIRGSTGTIAEVGGTIQRAMRVANRPVEAMAWNSVGVPTGLVTVAAAGGALFSLRNTGANLILVRRAGIGLIMTTAFGAAQRIEYGLGVARNWTVADSGGTPLSFASSNTDRKGSLSIPNVEARVATTAGLTAGTRTKDANYQSIVSSWVAAAIGNVSLPPPLDNLLYNDPGSHPIILANNEGIVIDNIVLMGATGVGIAYINVEFCEVVTTEF